MSRTTRRRTPWEAIAAAIAVSCCVGGLGVAQATTSSGEKPIYTPIEPCRLLDTRPASAVGPRTVGIGPQEVFTLDGWGAAGACTLPTGTTGLALNVTAVRPSLKTFLTFFPAGGAVPDTSNLNPAPGEPPAPNAVNVGLDTNGRFSLFNNKGVVDVIVDVVGVYDDHNHDDRYYTQDEVYTKAEVDALLASMSTRASVSDDSVGGALTSQAAVLDSVSIAVPAQGTVVVSASASFVNTNFTAAFLRCSISDDASLDSSAWQSMRLPEFGDTDAMGATRGFAVAAGENFVASLVCRAQIGDATIATPAMTAVFVPA